MLSFAWFSSSFIFYFMGNPFEDFLVMCFGKNSAENVIGNFVHNSTYSQIRTMAERGWMICKPNGVL